MIIPFLRKNGKFSLYDTRNDYKEGDKNYTSWRDNTNYKHFASDEFDFINFFKEGFAIVEDRGTKFFIDVNGNRLKTKYSYWDVRNFEEGIAAVRRDTGYRFINKNGIEIIDKEYDEYYRISPRLIEVVRYLSFTFDEVKEKYPVEFENGILDISGFEIIRPIKRVNIFSYKKFIEVIQQDFPKKTTLYDYFGAKIEVPGFKSFDYFDHFYKGRTIAHLKETKEYAIIDENFNVVVNLGSSKTHSIGVSCTMPDPFTGSYLIRGLCAYSFNGKWGFIDYNGNLILDYTYDYLGNFIDNESWSENTNGCAIAGKKIENEIKFGAINSEFEEIAEFIYDEISYFSENIASVRINKKWGAINNLGQIVVPIEYSIIYPCKQGYIQVGLGDFEYNKFIGVYGFFNKQGKKISKIIYQWLGSFESGFCIAQKRDRYGLIDSNGDEVVACIYDKMEGTAETGYLVEKDDIKHYVDKKGRKFIEE